MTNRKRFCIICGCEETPTVELTDGFCPKCLASEKAEVKIRAIPAIKFCRLCRSFEKQGKWVSASSDKLEEDLANVLKATLNRCIDSDQNPVSEVVIQRMPSTMDSNSLVVPVTVRFKTLNQEYSRLANDMNLSVRLIPTICPNCGLVKREYYEATLQIRANDGNMIEDERTILLNIINSLVDKTARKHKQAFVTRFENKPGGFDLYLGSSQLAHSIASRFRSKRGVLAKEAFKAGRLDKSTGKKKGKVTILIRLPHSEIDDLAKKGL